jgi:hypothetical protein
VLDERPMLKGGCTPNMTGCPARQDLCVVHVCRSKFYGWRRVRPQICRSARKWCPKMTWSKYEESERAPDSKSKATIMTPGFTATGFLSTESTTKFVDYRYHTCHHLAEHLGIAYAHTFKARKQKTTLLRRARTRYGELKVLDVCMQRSS